MSATRRAIYVAGHRGMVGSAIVRRAAARAATQRSADRHARRARPDRPARRCASSSRRDRIDHVFLAAAKVGGIQRQQHLPGRLHLREPDDRRPTSSTPPTQRACSACSSSARAASIRALAAQPMREDALLTGTLEADQRALRDRQDRRHQAVRELQPPVRARLPQRDADQPVRPGRQLPPRELATSSRRCCGASTRRVRAGAREVVIWGSGTPRREFLHVDDMADACVHVMDLPDERLPPAHAADAQPHQRRHAATTARSASWPRRSRASSASRAGWPSTRASPTARRAS